jgi:DNA-binding XRE family transcriptional regulator
MPRGVPVYHLYAYRVALGLTQAQCARAVGVSRVEYQRLESGKADPSRTTLRALAKVLHVAPSQLRRETETLTTYKRAELCEHSGAYGTSDGSGCSGGSMCSGSRVAQDAGARPTSPRPRRSTESGVGRPEPWP